MLIGIIAATEPLALPWVLAGSLLFGGVGGWAAAKRNGAITGDEIATQSISMALFGSSVSMVGWWYFNNDDLAGYLLVGFAGLAGLVGSVVFTPLTTLATAVLEGLSEALVAMINRALDKKDDTKRDGKRKAEQPGENDA